MNKIVYIIFVIFFYLSFLSCNKKNISTDYDITIKNLEPTELECDSVKLNFEIINNTDKIAYTYLYYSISEEIDYNNSVSKNISAYNGKISYKLANSINGSTIYYKPFVTVIDNKQKDTIWGEKSNVKMPGFPEINTEKITIAGLNTTNFSIQGENFLSIDTNDYSFFMYRYNLGSMIKEHPNIKKINDTCISFNHNIHHVWKKYTGILYDKDLNYENPNNDVGIFDSLNISIVGLIAINNDTVSVGDTIEIDLIYGTINDHLYFNGQFIDNFSFMPPNKLVYIIDSNFGTGDIVVSGTHTNSNDVTFDYAYYQNKKSFYIKE